MYNQGRYNLARYNQIYADKWPQLAPDPPELESKTPTSITLQTIEGCEYKEGSGAWQDSTLFEDLSPDTQYTFYARKKETEYYEASPSSAGTPISTFKIAESDVLLDAVSEVLVSGRKVAKGEVYIAALTSLNVSDSGKVGRSPSIPFEAISELEEVAGDKVARSPPIILEGDSEALLDPGIKIGQVNVPISAEGESTASAESIRSGVHIPLEPEVKISVSSRSLRDYPLCCDLTAIALIKVYGAGHGHISLKAKTKTQVYWTKQTGVPTAEEKYLSEFPIVVGSKRRQVDAADYKYDVTLGLDSRKRMILFQLLFTSSSQLVFSGRKQASRTVSIEGLSQLEVKTQRVSISKDINFEGSTQLSVTGGRPYPYSEVSMFASSKTEVQGYKKQVNLPEAAISCTTETSLLGNRFLIAQNIEMIYESQFSINTRKFESSAAIQMEAISQLSVIGERNRELITRIRLRGRLSASVPLKGNLRSAVILRGRLSESYTLKGKLSQKVYLRGKIFR